MLQNNENDSILTKENSQDKSNDDSQNITDFLKDLDVESLSKDVF